MRYRTHLLLIICASAAPRNYTSAKCAQTRHDISTRRKTEPLFIFIFAALVAYDDPLKTPRSSMYHRLLLDFACFIQKCMWQVAFSPFLVVLSFT